MSKSHYVATLAAAAAFVAGSATGTLLMRQPKPKPEVRYLTRTVEVPTVRYWPSEPKIVTVYKEREPIHQPTECVEMRWLDEPQP